MMNTEGNNGNKPLGLWNVVSIGIGAMVGAGIFALLGQAALLMEASTWVAFAFGGIVAMFSGYAYARLGASYPSNGGIIDFFRRGLGNGVFSLALSLLYLLTLAVSIAMVARAFGAYAVQFLHEGSQEEHLILLYALGIIAVMTLFNSLSNHDISFFARVGFFLSKAYCSSSKRLNAASRAFSLSSSVSTVEADNPLTEDPVFAGIFSTLILSSS